MFIALLAVELDPVIRVAFIRGPLDVFSIVWSNISESVFHRFPLDRSQYPCLDMTIIQTIPSELILEFFPHFCLKSLIAGAVLLRLDKRLMGSPSFFGTRPWSRDNLETFDGEAYVDELLAQHKELPEDFRLWRVARPCHHHRLRSAWTSGIAPVVHSIEFNVGCMTEWDDPSSQGSQWGSSGDGSVSDMEQGDDVDEEVTAMMLTKK
ncbi:hypothetical protein DFH09DRAFT_1343649 [Mycena vulgaris]|nr:hypothetical protein DFH09DRAFT_1343649 [Mycena vulgaris]